MIPLTQAERIDTLERDLAAIAHQNAQLAEAIAGLSVQILALAKAVSPPEFEFRETRGKQLRKN